jgi:membrane protein implicated in regulation of membrane protease activity
MRSPLALIRDIRYHSRRVEGSVFDRIQGGGFVAFAFIAPVVVWRMERIVVRETVEQLQEIRVFEPIDDTGRVEPVRAIDVPPDERDRPWPRSTPLATVFVEQRTVWRGSPLVTSDTLEVPVLRIERLPACRDARVAEVRRAAEGVTRRAQAAADAPRTRTHAASWVFSSGAWWVTLSFALAVVLAPLRLARFVYRRGRTVVRQSRIDRCHCPNCGYNARKSILIGRCPECGSELYERPDYD